MKRNHRPRFAGTVGATLTVMAVSAAFGAGPGGCQPCRPKTQRHLRPGRDVAGQHGEPARIARPPIGLFERVARGRLACLHPLAHLRSQSRPGR